MAYEWDKDKSVSWEIILTPEALESTARELADQKVFGWDVESDGLNPYKGKRIIGHAFAWRRPNGQLRSVYIPCRHDTYLGLFDVVHQLPPEMVTAAVKPALEGPALKCGHNLTFDVQIAAFDGIRVRPRIHDTLVAARLQNENHKAYRLPIVLRRANIAHQRGWKDFIKPDLEAQRKHLGIKMKELKDNHGYKYITIPRLGWYAVQDAAYELRLAEYQTPFCGQWPDIWRMEMGLFWVGVSMCQIGVPVNRNKLSDLHEQQSAEMAELAPKIWHLCGEEFEITNDTELRRIIFQKLNYPVQGLTRGTRGPTGRIDPNTKVAKVDDDALWSLETKFGCEVAGLIRQYNAAEKICSTYTLNLIELADAQGVLHGEFRQGGAATGRSSMAKPNLQNVPARTARGRQVKEAFEARPGKPRFCIDYSQIELRVLATLSQDPLLMKVYREDLDAHRTTAIEAFGTADKVNGIDMRRVAKILNFGIPFGITDLGVQRNINKDLPEGIPPIDSDTANGYLRAWFAKYAGVNQWRQQVWNGARQNKGLFWNLFGRPRRVDLITHPTNTWQYRSGQRKVVSSLVQGSAADLVKYCMVAVHEYLEAQTTCDAKMVLMVHDDLQFDIDAEGSAKVVREIARIMETTCQQQMKVPVKVDCEYFTTNWAEKKELHL